MADEEKILHTRIPTEGSPTNTQNAVPAPSPAAKNIATISVESVFDWHPSDAFGPAVAPDDLTLEQLDPNFVPLGGTYWHVPVGVQATGPALYGSIRRETGALISRPFPAPSGPIQLLVASWGDPTPSNVQLWVALTPQENKALGPAIGPAPPERVAPSKKPAEADSLFFLRQTQFINATRELAPIAFDLNRYAGRICALAIIDASTTSSLIVDPSPVGL